jgi:hypothetical protein
MGDCDHDHSHYVGVGLHVADGVLRTMSRNGLSLTKMTWLTMLPAHMCFSLLSAIYHVSCNLLDHAV